MPNVGVLALYVGVAIVGALGTIAVCVWSACRIPDIQEDFNCLALAPLVVMSIAAGGPAGALIGVALAFASRRWGFAGGAALASALVAGVGLARLLCLARQETERAQIRADEARLERARGESRRMLEAARRGDLAVVREYLDRGVFVDAFKTHDPRYGETALMLAARGGHVELARLLLERGARPERRNERGQTALDLAQRHGHSAVTALLAAALSLPPEGAPAA